MMNLSEYQNYHETKPHTTADFPYNTYLCSIPRNFPSVPLHWHAELEMIVIKKGRGIVSADLEKRPVTSGDIILIRLDRTGSGLYNGIRKYHSEAGTAHFRQK